MAREGLMDDCGYNFDVDEDSYNSGFKDGFLMAVDEFAEKLKREFDENIFSDEEKFKYDRRTQEAICAQNATWKVAIQYVEKLAEQLKEE